MNPNKTLTTKIYKCDDELIAVIKKYGFRESTNAYERSKGKKRFRKGKLTDMQIYFNYENFVLYEQECGCVAFENDQITASDLRLLLWYVNSSAEDREHISDGHYDIRTAKQNYDTMKSLLGFYLEFKRTDEERQRFERLLAAYEAISLN